MTARFAGFEGYRQQIPKAIEQVLDEFAASLPEVSEDAEWVLRTMRQYALRSSKRIRGCLAAAIFDDATGASHSESGLGLAAAIELAQNYLLIIDDVIDRSAIRRGEPTVHELYKKTYVNESHEANMVAILVGELHGQVVNFALLSLEEPAERIVAAMQQIVRDLSVTDLAQVDDIRQQFGRKITEADLLRKHEQKSSYYSFVSPLAAGLLLAGKDAALAVKESESFGLPAGVAFQLRDDYLGLFGDSSDTGKPNLDDMREGKNTLMVHYAEQHASAAERAQMNDILGNDTAGEHELSLLQAIVRRNGGDVFANAHAEACRTQAEAAARSASSWSSTFGELLAELVAFSVERKG